MKSKYPARDVNSLACRHHGQNQLVGHIRIIPQRRRVQILRRLNTSRIKDPITKQVAASNVVIVFITNEDGTHELMLLIEYLSKLHINIGQTIEAITHKLYLLRQVISAK